MLDQKQLPDVSKGGLKRVPESGIVGPMLILNVDLFISFNSLKSSIVRIPRMFMRYDLSVHIFVMITR